MKRGNECKRRWDRACFISHPFPAFVEENRAGHLKADLAKVTGVQSDTRKDESSSSSVHKKTKKTKHLFWPCPSLYTIQVEKNVTLNLIH